MRLAVRHSALREYGKHLANAVGKPTQTLVGVALIKDEVPNIARFVELNLKHGLDHLIIFLDDPHNPLPATAMNSRHVTIVRMDSAWWGGRRPLPLNRRQRVAANLARVALARVGWADWLIFLDGDEAAVLDRRVVEKIPEEMPAFRLWPLEAISDDRTEKQAFKRRLSRPQLRALRRSGVISKPRNSAYFRGHSTGKTAIRPTMHARFEVHHAIDESGEKLPRFEHDGLRHVHFESETFEEFVRKWTALAESGPPPGLRRERPTILDRFTSCAERSAEELHAHHRALYERHIRDDGTLLDSMGLLEHIDLDSQTHRAVSLDRRRANQLSMELSSLSGVPKHLFLSGVPTGRLQAGIDSASSRGHGRAG